MKRKKMIPFDNTWKGKEDSAAFYRCSFSRDLIILDKHNKLDKRSVGLRLVASLSYSCTSRMAWFYFLFLFFSLFLHGLQGRPDEPEDILRNTLSSSWVPPFSTWWKYVPGPFWGKIRPRTLHVDDFHSISSS